jgi:flagellar protein FliO/FliZ
MGLFGTEMPLAIQFCLAFLTVLGLIGAIAWGAHRFGKGRSGGNLRGGQFRLSTLDSARVDGRRCLDLVRRDNFEHLLMIGGPTDLVIEANISTRAAAVSHEVLATRSPSTGEPRPIPLVDQEPISLLPKPTMLHPAARIKPSSEEPAPSVLRSRTEMSTRPQREMLAALASELSTRPPPPRKNPITVTRQHPTELRQAQLEPRVKSQAQPRIVTPPPISATLAGGRTTSAADENLAHMARRLEVVLHKPNVVADAVLPATPTRASSSLAQASAVGAKATAPVRVLPPGESKPHQSDAKSKQSTIPNSSLEQELASWLGRSTRH